MSQPAEPERRPPIVPVEGFRPSGRARFGVITALAGLAVFLLGADPGIFGLDRSPVTGFVQIAVFLVGLALIALGGYLALRLQWNGGELTITADIGARLISTGYVVAVASGMADVFGFGSESFPRIPDFGVWQQRGVLAGQILIGLGFVLLTRWKADQPRGEADPAGSQPPAGG
jgi:hypothetical protein